MIVEKLADELREAFVGEIAPNTTAWLAVARRAKELLGDKPVATREAVGEWYKAQVGKGPHEAETSLLLSALAHFAPPRQRMMIEGMGRYDISQRIRERWDDCLCNGESNWRRLSEEAASIIHDLANTPAPEVDADAGAREMCNAWVKLQNAKPGPLRDLVPEFDDGDEEWKRRWRDHYGWVLSGFPKPPTWAVAAKEKGNE